MYVLTIFDDVLVSKQEDNSSIFNTEFVIEDFEILSERLFVVTATQLNLKDFALGSERRQATDALLATPTDTDQQGVTLRHSEHAMNSGEMVQGVIKKNQIHRRLTLVVLFKNLGKINKQTSFRLELILDLDIQVTVP